MRCLIVDDNKHFLKSASRMLERGGVAIVGVASTSAEALKRAAELRPDVTLVDVHLGEESGFDLAKKLRRETAQRNPAVVLISAYPEQELAERIAASPALGFVRKSALSAGVIRDLIATRGDDGSSVTDPRGT